VLFRSGIGQPLEAGLANERRNIGLLFQSADAREGFAAFTEKRSAKFIGR
jgi:enoyl-CoA hydratase/carnithine racemase